MKYVKIASVLLFVLVLLTACKRTCVHEYQSEITKEASCSQAGVETYTCIHCKDTYTTQVSVKTHDFSEKAEQKPATCSEPGQLVYTCKSCGEQKTEEITALDHEYGEGTVQQEPSCSEPGVMAYKCNYCNAVKTEEIPVIPHTPAEPVLVKEPNCTEQGEICAVCTVCGHAEIVEYVPVNGQHTMEEAVIKESTCMEHGYGEKQCTLCGYAEQITYEYAQHPYGDFVQTQPATCSAEGIKERTCNACGYVDRQSIEMLSHTWDKQVCNKPATCTVCGYYNASGIAHKYEFDSEIQPSKYFVGRRIYKCENCGRTYEEYFGKRGDYDLDAINSRAYSYAKSLGLKVYYDPSEDPGYRYDPSPDFSKTVQFPDADANGGEAYIRQMADDLIYRVYRYCEEELSGAEYYAVCINVYYTQSGAIGMGYFGVAVYLMSA